jgi:hypothetical protein
MVPPIPKRSRLYSLEPMNIGTAEVESLTGYLARVAEAHCVTVSDLVGAELSHPACPTPLFTPYPGRERSNSFYTQLYAVNGIADVPAGTFRFDTPGVCRPVFRIAPVQECERMVPMLF